MDKSGITILELGKMKNIYYAFLAMISAAVCCVSCNNEWEDEQYVQTVAFKATANSLGVTPVYVRYKSEGNVTYKLPVIMGGSTMSSRNQTIHIGLASDTLEIVNKEAYGHREELYFRELETDCYNMPETVDIPAGESTTTLPIDFSLAELDQSDKWVLPLRIMSDPSYSYQANPHKYFQRAILNVNPFNDYSGTYSGTLYKIYFAPDTSNPLTVTNVKTYVKDENTVFFYAGLRDIDYLDRKLYKIFVEFTDEKVDVQKNKLRIYTDNPEINLEVQGTPCYTVEEEMDATKVYMKHIYITLYLDYTFEDYTTIPDRRIKYTVTGSLAMQRDLNTLIPDEDQQIQWD